MNITSFKVSEDKSNLELALTDASAATTLYLWTNKTYKTEGLEIDLSTKLTGAANPVIYITPEDIGLSYFDGVYFIEISDGINTLDSIAAELTRYKECIVDKVLATKSCDSCLEIEDISTLNAQTSLYSLELALTLKAYQEILTLTLILDKVCSGDCKGCGEYKII